MTDQRTYPEYLQSNHWKFTRSKILERDKYSCLVCAKKADNVHHINYKNWLDVVDEDLMSVCKGCHYKIHLAIDNGYILSNNTSSIEKTLTGLSALSENKPLTYKQITQKTKFILDKQICENLDTLPNYSKQLLCGIFKCPRPKSFSLFQGRRVGKTAFRKIQNIIAYRATIAFSRSNFLKKG